MDDKKVKKVQCSPSNKVNMKKNHKTYYIKIDENKKTQKKGKFFLYWRKNTIKDDKRKEKSKDGEDKQQAKNIRN